MRGTELHIYKHGKRTGREGFKSLETPGLLRNTWTKTLGRETRKKQNVKKQAKLED